MRTRKTPWLMALLCLALGGCPAPEPTEDASDEAALNAPDDGRSPFDVSDGDAGVTMLNQIDTFGGLGTGSRRFLRQSAGYMMTGLKPTLDDFDVGMNGADEPSEPAPPADPAPPFDPNDPITPPGDDPNEPPSDDPEPDPPGETSWEAVNTVVEQMMYVGRVFATLIPMADERMTFADNSGLEFGECPNSVWVASPEYGLVGIDYSDDGCYGPMTANEWFRSWVAAIVTKATGDYEIGFDDLDANGWIALGRIYANVVKVGRSATMDANCRFEFEQGPFVFGNAEIRLMENGPVTFIATDLSLGSAGHFRPVICGGLRFDPIGNLSFIPDDGWIEFTFHDPPPASTAHVAVVRFDEQSPQDRTVLVTVDDGEPMDYTLPEF